jgi:hypothetical protein
MITCSECHFFKDSDVFFFVEDVCFLPIFLFIQGDGRWFDPTRDYQILDIYNEKYLDSDTNRSASRELLVYA